MVAEIELFKILKTRFTDSEAESIVASIEQKVHSSFEERKNDFSTKDDISKLEIRLLEKIAETNHSTKDDISKLEIRLLEKIAETNHSTKDDISKLEIRLLEKIAETNQRITETKAEVIKWMFIFWIGQLASIIAIIKFMAH